MKVKNAGQVFAKMLEGSVLAMYSWCQRCFGVAWLLWTKQTSLE